MKENKNQKDKYIGAYLDSYIAATRVICKCGHRVNFMSKIPYIYCSHCHRLIFRNQKAEYDYRLKRRLGV